MGHHVLDGSDPTDMPDAVDLALIELQFTYVLELLSIDVMNDSDSHGILPVCVWTYISG